jgi:hypothetical protein
MTMKKALFFLVVATLLTAACGEKKEAKVPANIPADAISLYQNAPGDSALYGLACDGCTDSVLVFLPYSGGDPDTFDIISAFQHHRIYGRPHIGDELAVILNPEDRAEALMVFNTEELKGTWCYMVSPKLRNVESMPRRMQRRMIESMPDSVKQLLIVPREYSLRLKRDNTAMVRGGMRRQTTTDDMSPVEYPAVKRYTEWRLFNGRLILKADTIPGFTLEGQLPESDTVDIELLTNDSLVLRFKDHSQSYYRKVEGETRNKK